MLDFLTKYQSKDHWLIANRYPILFVVMVAHLLVPGFFPAGIRSVFITPVLNVALLLACLLIVQKRRKIAIYVGILGIVGVTFNWFEGFTRLSGLVVFSVYIGIVGIELFGDLIAKKNIERRDIIGALDGYLLLGYIGALLFLAVNLGYEGAFSNISAGNAGGQDLLYFSYITMLTIGYGEIVPLIPASRGLAIILGLLGQFYLVVVIATFVGKFLKKTDSDE